MMRCWNPQPMSAGSSATGRVVCPRSPCALPQRSRRQCLVVSSRAARYDRRKPPPPDLPSLLFDQRIVYLGMPLVPAVTELMVAELLYLEKQGSQLPIEMLINSSGTTRQDGEILAFDSEGIALTSAMGFVRSPISTVNMGLAVGWSCAVLAFGKKGWRKSLPHSLAMIQQPRVPPTGQRQAIEVHIKWREVLDYKREYLRMLSIGTGWPVDKLDADMQRPLYMRPQDALRYNVIDEVIEPDEHKAAKAERYWLRSGRAESDGRIEQWSEYLSLQEEGVLLDCYKKETTREVRRVHRERMVHCLSGTRLEAKALEGIRERAGEAYIPETDEVRLPFNYEGLKLAVLNAERFADRNIQRHVDAGMVSMPDTWTKQLAEMEAEAAKEEEEEDEEEGGQAGTAVVGQEVEVGGEGAGALQGQAAQAEGNAAEVAAIAAEKREEEKEEEEVNVHTVAGVPMSDDDGEVDYEAFIRAIDAMDEDEFLNANMEQLIDQFVH
ncbi:ClpP/crotonase-like domain-containing protein [Haematococcus lacustris]